ASAIGDGRAQWSDPVVNYLPEFALSDRYVTTHVTIADLFAHRSGLPDHAGDLLEDIGYDRPEILHKLRFLPLDPFRSTYQYTNFGLTAGAEAIARAADTTWAELSQTQLYEPLGMSATSSRFADFMATPNKALGHVIVDGTWQLTPSQRQPDAQSPAGGVSSSAVDMAMWMMMVLGEGVFEGQQIVAPEPLREALTPHMTSTPAGSLSGRAGFYGLGFNVGIDGAGRTRFSHSGAFLLGTGATFALLPSENLGLVVLTNGEPIGVAEAIAASFMDLAETGAISFDWFALYPPLFAQLSENPSKLAGKEPPINPAPAASHDTYIGRYENDYFGLATVAETDNGELLLTLGPKAFEFPLSHWDGNVFSFLPTGENALGISAITFGSVSQDRATALTVEHLDELDLGTFQRVQ
ncbi:MAG: serine hydrolase, partial [Cyanobacteria bacterium J06639_1]